MTDTTNFVQNSQAITSDLNFQLKPSGVRSRSYRASILPTNKTTFNPTDTCIIYIPGGRRNTYLDCNQTYMRMTIKNPTGFAFSLDVSAFSVINRIDVYHGGNLLETIQSYNVLATYICDMQTSLSSKYGLGNMLGFDNIAGTRSGRDIPANGQYTACLPIFSGVCGVLTDKMLPLGLLADDIRLEITFETSALGIVGAAGAAYSILDFQLNLTIVELSDEGENMVRSNYSYPETPLYLHGSSWRHYTSTLPSLSAGGFSTLIPARFASLKQIALCPRRSVEIADVTSHSIGSRVNPNFQYYWFRIGSSIVPSKQVTLEGTNTGGYAEAYAELLKSWHDLHTTSGVTCLGVEYLVADAAVANCPQVAVTGNIGGNSFRNGFVIAQELESFSQRNDVLLSGMNTLNSQVFFETNIGTALAAGSGSYTLNFFAWYDHILVLDRGMLSVKI